MKYCHRSIEKKWQKYWEENNSFQVEVDKSKPKYYILDMFPFISGAGIHLGHPVGYTATDILARYKKLKGFNVLHPMGWDSFGLPAEQHAIRTGRHPSLTVAEGIDKFRRQLKCLGYTYDWSREFATSDEKYYKWTQWIFTKLYEKGLAYEACMPVNYCPALGTVLANEEIEEGKSIIGGHPVERRPLKQWILKITAYAERLIEDLEDIDWPESLKRMQINWIGKSVGANIRFPVQNHKEHIEVYTTRPDTLFGATYMVLAPEHPLVAKLCTEDRKKDVEEYQKIAASKSDLDRTDLNKDKTGVFIGAYVVNPVNKEKVPIWISDYVLMTYGTGAIMAVPAHDERDFAFAEKYELPIIAVFDPNVDAHPEFIGEHEDVEVVRQEVVKGQRCWPGEGKCIHSSYTDISLNGLNMHEAKEKISDWLESQGHGQRAVSYKLRDWLFSRQRYWGEPMPILHFEDGTQRALALDELPLCPPDLDDYKPSGDGQGPLARAKDWVNIVDPKTKQKARREINTMPQWAGSCWYYLRFCDPDNDQEAWSKEKESYWMPVDMYVGGVEHAVLHLLYARFWHKVLYDCGYVSTKEPFMTLRNQGLIVSRAYQDSTGSYVPTSEVEERDERYYHRETKEELKSQIEKMSKSKLNGVSPDELIEEFGADALRLYLMFMAPLDRERIWNTDAISGCRRFLSRFFDMATSEKVCDESSEEANKLVHRLVYGVENDIQKMQYNTAIAKMMEFINHFTKLSFYPKEALCKATQMLSPFAPHIAEEIWEHLGNKGLAQDSLFPKAEEKYLQEDQIVYVIQVNGRVRGRLCGEKGKSKEEVVQWAKDNESVAKHLANKTIVKEIYVADKILNLVVK